MLITLKPGELTRSTAHDHLCFILSVEDFFEHYSMDNKGIPNTTPIRGKRIAIPMLPSDSFNHELYKEEDGWHKVECDHLVGYFKSMFPT